MDVLIQLSLPWRNFDSVLGLSPCRIFWSSSPIDYHKTKPFLPLPLTRPILNNILLSKQVQVHARLRHIEPRSNFLTQGIRPKIFMQKYVCIVVFILTHNHAAARHFTGLPSLSPTKIVLNVSVMYHFNAYIPFHCESNGMVLWWLTAVFPLCYKQHQQLILISLKKQPTFELSEGKKNVQNALPEE